MDNINKDLPGLDDKVIEITFTDSTIQGTHYKMVRIDVWEEIQAELKTLRMQRQSILNAWATDLNPESIMNRVFYDGNKRLINTNTETESILLDKVEEEVLNVLKRIMFQIK